MCTKTENIKTRKVVEEIAFTKPELQILFLISLSMLNSVFETELQSLLKLLKGYNQMKKLLGVLNLQEAQSYADDNSLLFMETSAKTSMNVNEIFMAIGK